MITTTKASLAPAKGGCVKLGIERAFDLSLIAEMALREKQIQQNYRPIIAVHKWFARRPGTLYRGLLLSEFEAGPLRESFFRPHSFSGIRIADPFMGGGTPLLEANRMGCDIIGFDINPMAFWIVREEIEHVDLQAYRHEAEKLVTDLREKIGVFYKTRCGFCGQSDADAKYFLWVKTLPCETCDATIDLFPGYLVAEDRRHPKNVFVCPRCGELSEHESRRSPNPCRACAKVFPTEGLARNGRCKCALCGTINSYPRPNAGAPSHRMYAIEYFCRRCKSGHQGRFFKKPDADDLRRYAEATTALKSVDQSLIPDDAIPPGDETNRLHRWGYKLYCEMFNARQLLGLAQGFRTIYKVRETRLRDALATNLSDLLRYQNMLCRYDTMALKSLDIFSVHGFPVGLVHCESNFIGIADERKKTLVGSGGWLNIIDKYSKAKAYCDAPFEVRTEDGRERRVDIAGEWIGESRPSQLHKNPRTVDLRCESATAAELRPHSLDAVFTDPPYFGNVQYAELMDFCYVWLKRLVEEPHPIFHAVSTRNADELTGNTTMERGLEHFTEGMSQVFVRMAKALKPGSPLAFTYHHNSLEAYYPVAAAILDSGLRCSASLPCPGEMGGSIHINGTGSSILDTIFVCRSTGSVPRRWIVDSAEGIASLVQEDIAKLRAGTVTPTRGDLRCIIFGHLVRMAIWNLRSGWENTRVARAKLDLVDREIRRFGGLAAVEKHMGTAWKNARPLQSFIARQSAAPYRTSEKLISF